MPKTTHTRFTAAEQTPTYVERTALPRLFLQGKSGIRYHAYVHCYVAGPPVRRDGADITPLYYLSLVATRGHGSALRGLWSSLVAWHLEELCIDGLNRVALAHHLLVGLPYRLPWQYHQDALDSGELHAVIESPLLTMWDPLRAISPRERTRQRTERVQLATMSKKDAENQEQAVLRQRHPLFLVCAPGSLTPRHLPEEADHASQACCADALRQWREQQHFVFLDPRYPFPLAPQWASFLWQRGIRRGEITRLVTWSPSVTQLSENGYPPFSVPFFLETWLCRPNIVQIKRDLDEARAKGELALPGGLDPVVAEHPEEALVGSRA